MKVTFSTKPKLYKRRFIYFYKITKKGYTLSGIATLHFKIVTQTDLEAAKELISDSWNESVRAVDGLSYLGREPILHWVKHCLGKCL